MQHLSTFDCFDTVITRAIGQARGLNYVLAERLRREGVIDMAPECFVRAYSEAEDLAHRRHGERRSLHHTAVQLAELLDLPPAEAPRLRAAEEAVELELIRAVPGQVEAIARARAAGARIGFISDTALSRATVEGMLRQVGAFEDGDLLRVSNELGADKAQGTAFLAIARELGPAPRRWHHTGDDQRADVLMARLSGVRATLTTSARLTADERLLDAAAPANGGLSCLLAGAARGARLGLEAQGEQSPHGEQIVLSPARIAGLTGIVAPVLVGLLLWALQRAHRDKRSRIVLAGPGSSALAAIAAPLARARAEAGWLDPPIELEVGSGRVPLQADDLLLRPALRRAPGPSDRRDWRSPVLHLGVHSPDGAVIDEEGYLTDETAGTGMCGEQASLTEVAAVLIAQADGSAEQQALRVFGEQLATTLPLLPHTVDLRSALRPVLQRFWSSPSRTEALEWSAVVGQAMDSRWWAASLVVLPAPLRVMTRSWGPLRAAHSKVARARQILGDRRATAHRTSLLPRASPAELARRSFGAEG